MPSLLKFFKLKHTGSTGDVDPKFGGALLIDIATLIRGDKYLYEGCAPPEDKREEVRRKVKDLFDYTHGFLNWADSMRKYMSEPFTEHAFIFYNLFDLNEEYEKKFGPTRTGPGRHDFRHDNRVLRSEFIISEETASRASGVELHDGFRFTQANFCKDWDEMSDEEKLKFKAFQFVHDIDTLKNASE